MNEKVLSLFTAIGPHAKDALDSYITLLWAELIMGCIVAFSFIIILCFFLYFIIKES